MNLARIMLKKIDLYFIKKFLSIFFFMVFIFIMILVIIDFSEKIEKFIESEIMCYEIFVFYYFGFIMFIVGLFWLLYILIVVIFFILCFVYNLEVIFIFNVGISFW